MGRFKSEHRDVGRMMGASIVILTYNNSDLAIQLAGNAYAIGLFERIVLVDNCSSDDTYEKLRHAFSENQSVAVIRAPKNGGYAYGNNLGAKWVLSNTQSGIIFFANPDVVFDRRCVECICNEFQDASYSVLAPVMLKPGGAVDEENYWDEPEYWDELGKCFCLYRRATVKKRIRNIDYEKKVMDVFAVTGSFFAIRASDYIRINGFDEGTFLFCEENILGSRLKRAGQKTGLITYISYVHNHSQIIDSNLSIIRKYTIQMKSHYYFAKHYLGTNRIKLAVLKAAQLFSIAELKCILLFAGRR